MLSILTSLKFCHVMKSQTLCNAQMGFIALGKAFRKYWKRRKCWLAEFSPFPTMFFCLSTGIVYLYTIPAFKKKMHLMF